jgi:hypothetical protein
MTLYPCFRGGNSEILGLEPLPGASNNFIVKISLKHFLFTIHLQFFFSDMEKKCKKNAHFR